MDMMEVSCRDLGHAQFPELSKAFREFAAKIPNRVPLFAKFRDSVQVVTIVQVVRCNSQPIRAGSRFCFLVLPVHTM